jgi:cation transport regulator ChaC
VPKEDTEEVLENLDFREKGGYTRAVVGVELQDGQTIKALLYTGNTQNPNFVQEPDQVALAARIARAHGPSGPNAEYLFELADFLRSVGADDPHIFELERMVKQTRDLSALQDRVLMALRRDLAELKVRNGMLVAQLNEQS